MNPFESDVKNIISYLEEAHANISTIHNPEMPMLKNKILVDLKRHINTLKIQVGVEPDPILNQAPAHSGPIKKMFGRDVTKSYTTQKDVNKPFHQTVEDVELAELRLKADELYPRFLITSSDQLLDSVSDIEIRAVAKRAGLPVTETHPKNISVDYIDQIKNAIRMQNKPANNELPDEGPDQSANIEDQLFAELPTLDSKEIVNIYTDAQIRAVAKRAGLPVTENSPAKVDKKFVDQVKAAMKKSAELNELAGNV